MFTKIAFIHVVVLALLTGCGTSMSVQSEDNAAAASAQNKPAPDAQLTVKQFVDAHGAVMAGIGDVKASNQKILTGLDEIKSSNQKALETAKRSLQIIEEMASLQGTGEITIFFPNSSANLEKASLEHDRLVRFADFLSRESRGRKIIFLSIGSSSAFGNQKVNLDLAKKRSEVPLDILDKYLINIPHEFHKVFGTGDLHSPKDVKMKEHQRHQHTRVIAVFDKDQASKINDVAK